MADDKTTTNQRVEQNDPNGAILKTAKTDLLSGGIHQFSILRATVVVDSHMHIQSGHCAPLQWFQDINCLTKIMSRGVLEGLGIGGGYLMEFFGTLIPIAWLFQPPFTKSKIRQLTEQGAKSTLECGEDFITKEREKAYNEFLVKEDLYSGLSNLVLTCVVMTMDMEYAHVDGYYGLKIYNALYKSKEDYDNLEPCNYWCPVHGVWEERTDNNVESPTYGQKLTYLDKIASRDEKQYTKTDVEGPPVSPIMLNDYDEKNKKNGAIIGSYFDIKTNRTMQVKLNNTVPVLMSKGETKQYEQWEKQLRDTELTVLKYPLKLLPMFHYDPRRWQTIGKTGNDHPMSMVSGENSLYLGFKMYTAQGYKPWDITRLPLMMDFYEKCCKNRIPIMNHGTPGGAASYEKDKFANYSHYNDSSVDKDQQIKDKAKHKGDAEAYFNEHFVSPDAWKNVLDTEINGTHLNDLYLCLAHFGGPTDLGMEWGRKLTEMINSDKYPNLYTDISSSFADKGFRDKFIPIIMANPKLKDRILFGTDWYMSLYYDKLVTGKNFHDYCKTTKELLDKFDPSLWPKFTQHNPYKFYRLDQNITRIAKTIIKRRLEDDAIIRALGDFDQKDINKIEKEAAYIKVANGDYVQIWETPICKA